MTVDATTAALFDRLPGYQQAGDEAQGDRPLLTLLSIGGAQQERVRVLADRLDRRRLDPTVVSPSDLADPDLADAGWLPWLEGGVGATIGSPYTEEARRDAIRYAPAGYLCGTKLAIAGAARTALTGTKYVRVFEHSIYDPGDSDWQHMLLITRVSETPDVPAVLAAVAAQRAKPAGVKLHHRAYTATLAETRAALGADTLAARKAMFPRLSDASDYLP